ncbi:hypothetical protein DFP72DRAFT_1108913 [Ephemerocybe angulata]|uniref:CxC1-like cysteine cluster associated with KDZ transposases domain-containing protein n=1 Tax=Ephemerocybe angulata TaxID=980116 RepID=A0A8H6I4R4_9AGAR|nr:hypothetical protein DFP72DRAFT_1108913 [Tulosesus angulatus]
MGKKKSQRRVNGTFGTIYGGSLKRPLNGIEALAANRKEKEKQRKLDEHHMDKETKEALADIRGDALHEAFDIGGNDDDDDASSSSQWVDINENLSPEELARAVDAAAVDPKWSKRHYRDGRTWRNRRQRFDNTWAEHFEALTDAYLRWKYPGSQNAASPSPSNRTDLDLHIATADLYTLEKEATIPRRDDQMSMVALVEAGYLGNSPLSPSLAISLKTLELFKVIRQRRPSFSFEAFAKVLCDLYQRPYHRRWRIALADAFDVFLSITRKVDERVAGALGRLSENWRVLNACPCCMYELQGEKKLIFRILMALDGNNSAKRVANSFRQTGDSRVFLSSYWVDEPEVNKFKLDEIRTTRGPLVPSSDAVWDGDLAEEDEKANVGDVPECVKNWKAAQTDAKKRALDMFDETGWFVCGCRHGLILWAADMVQSGEQAKYPLSIVNRALEVLGERLLIGYDIGCAFEGTIKSTTLGKKFTESGSRCCVNAYHGYAHNYACQCANHPNNIEGCGIEDLETMERFFSASNATASVIRYTSRYRRRLFLDLHLQQSDRDKYASLGLMLRNNYRQAIKIIEEGVPLLNAILSEIGASRADLDVWQRDQAQYFATLGKEPEEDVHKVAYVELLKELEAAEKIASSKTSKFLNLVADDWDPSGGKTYETETSQTRKLETDRKHARAKVDGLRYEITAMELKLGLTTRWHPGMPQYKETVQYIHDRSYRKALDELQRLVVQRLFELHRLGLSGIGYRARTLLTKAMRTRSKAIQNAAARYNAAALELTPPRPTLDWTMIAKYNFVEEFSLLRDARQDVRGERWGDGEVREALKLHQKIKRASEELERLNIEVKRLATSIYDEHTLFEQVSTELRNAGSDQLLGALIDFSVPRKRVNRNILQYLEEITELDGYTGDTNLLGLRVGSAPRTQATGLIDSNPREASSLFDLMAAETDDEDEDEEAQIGGVLDFIGEVALS